MMISYLTVKIMPRFSANQSVLRTKQDALKAEKCRCYWPADIWASLVLKT